MTTSNEPICCMVIAPLSATELDRIAAGEYRKTFPFALDRNWWEVVQGSGRYAALISRLPGSEGSDWTLAEIVSRRVGPEPVYSIWFDPERSTIVEWRAGNRIGEHPDSPVSFAGSLGFQLEPPDVEPTWTPPPNLTVAVIEGTSVANVRRALGAHADKKPLNVEEGKAGVIVSATDGQLGTESWDLSEALPNAIIYHLQRDFHPEEFSVLILKGGDVTASLRIPPFESEISVRDIKGASTPEDVFAVLGVRPSLLGFGL